MTVIHLKSRLGVVSRRSSSALERSRYQTKSLRGRGGLSRSLHHVLYLPTRAPEWAACPEMLWHAAGLAERRHDATEARTIDVTWPRQLPTGLIPSFCARLATDFVAGGYAMQADGEVVPASDLKENPHVHFQVATRRLSGDGFAATKCRRHERLWRRGGGVAIRERIAQALREAAREAGIEVEVRQGPDEARICPPEPRLRRDAIEEAKPLLEQRRRSLADLRAVCDEIAALEEAIRVELEAHETQARDGGVQSPDNEAPIEQARPVAAPILLEELPVPVPRRAAAPDPDATADFQAWRRRAERALDAVRPGRDRRRVGALRSGADSSTSGHVSTDEPMERQPNAWPRITTNAPNLLGREQGAVGECAGATALGRGRHVHTVQRASAFPDETAPDDAPAGPP